MQLTRYNGALKYNTYTYTNVSVNLALKAGYRCSLSASGFYGSALPWLEGGDGSVQTPFALGAGKRFTFSDGRFLETGVELTGGFVSRANLKVLVSLL